MIRLSIALEWENVDFAGSARTAALLEVLGSQVDALAGPVGTEALDGAAARPALARPVELIVAYDPAGNAEAALRAAVEAALGAHAAAFRLRFAAVPGGRYYALKNRGAALASGDVVLFLDSDVIPLPDWLARLIAPFTDEKVEGVAGISVIESRGVLGKAMGLCGVFPLPPDEDVIERRRHFFANNLALRRSLAIAAPFPVLEVGVARVACAHLAARLYDGGHAVYVHTGARVSHPAPNGLRHFLVRALAHGRDDLYLPGQAIGTLASDLRRGFDRTEYYLRRVWRERRRAGLSARELALVLGVTLVFHSVRTLGHVLTHAFPRSMHRRFLRV